MSRWFSCDPVQNIGQLTFPTAPSPTTTPVRCTNGWRQSSVNGWESSQVDRS